MSSKGSPSLRWEDRQEARWGQGQLSVTWAVTSGESPALVIFFPSHARTGPDYTPFLYSQRQYFCRGDSPTKFDVLLDSTPLKALVSSLLVKLPPSRIAFQS